MTIADATTYRFTRAMYDQMVNAGILEDQHVELIGGEIVQMSPINYPHSAACGLLSEMLRECFGKGYHVFVQAPLGFEDSEPQPDIAVVRGTPRAYKDHPSTALLVVEISDSTLRFDRKTKASLYASAGIRDYWLLNLKDRQLEVRRTPKRDRSQRFGYRYADLQVLKGKGSVRPLVLPDCEPLRVADMLP
jgi:Uma2 family endonuclease